MKNKKESSGQLSLFGDLEEKKSTFEIIDGKKSSDCSAQINLAGSQKRTG